MSESPSYHDLFITTATIPRTSIFSLGYGLRVTCTRAAGWRLWDASKRPDNPMLLAGEYDEHHQWLVLDVGGMVIVDSRRDAYVGAASTGSADAPGGWNGVVNVG